MKRGILVILILFSFITLIGCQNLQSTNTELVYDTLSEKEEYLTALTGNKVIMYKLKNLPKDKEYTISLTYEAYKNGEKIKDEEITSIFKDDLSDEVTEKTIGINIQKNNIRYILANDRSYASGEREIEEGLIEFSQTFLSEDVDLPIGSEFYIFYGTSGNSISSSNVLGVPIDSSNIKDIIKNNESNVFIKLSFKEV